MKNLLKKSVFNCIGYLAFCLSLSISCLAQASDGKQVLIPIAGDIIIFVPLISTPATVTTSVATQTVGGSIYTINWTAVANAAYYQILMTDDRGEKTYFETTSLNYKLAGLPVGNTRVEILACDSQNRCGAGALVGTYNVTEKVTYAHADILGSPILETDQAGSVVQEFHYKPFGDTKEAKKETVGYTGHLEDTDLNLTYMQARYYDPVIGRFYENDPVGFVTSNPMSFNRYSYVNNNPYKYTDPTGEYGVAGVAYGAVAGAVGGYVASGAGLQDKAIGVIAGALAGGLVGSVAPQISHGAGAAVVLAVSGAAASAAGQAVGSAANAAVEKGVENVIASDIKVSSAVTVAGASGTVIGGLVGKGVASITSQSLIGNSLEAAGTPLAAGLVAGAVVEGVISGAAEKVATPSSPSPPLPQDQR